MAAFSITYLLQLDMTGENITIGIQREMLPWIMAASLGYGMLALFLALIMGGYQPIRIVERGGWMAALGMSRGGRSASSLRRARDNFSASPHGSLSMLVNRRMLRGNSLISTGGNNRFLREFCNKGMVLNGLGEVIFQGDLEQAMVLVNQNVADAAEVDSEDDQFDLGDSLKNADRDDSTDVL